MPEPVTVETFMERVKGGRYAFAGRAHQALSRTHLTKPVKDQLKEAIALHFQLERPTKKKKVHRKSGKTAKKRPQGKKAKFGPESNKHGSANGNGENRVVTLFKLVSHRDMGPLLMRLSAKSIDEGKTLPELHEEISELFSLTSRVRNGK
jgi:hypothetical protein